jgi:hypothetical protein
MASCSFFVRSQTVIGQRHVFPFEDAVFLRVGASTSIGNRAIGAKVEPHPLAYGESNRGFSPDGGYGGSGVLEKRPCLF